MLTHKILLELQPQGPHPHKCDKALILAGQAMTQHGLGTIHAQ